MLTPKAACAFLALMILAEVRAGPASLPGDGPTPHKAAAAAAVARPGNGQGGGSHPSRPPASLKPVDPEIAGKPCM